jgi:hypothetical protein
MYTEDAKSLIPCSTKVSSISAKSVERTDSGKRVVQPNPRPLVRKWCNQTLGSAETKMVQRLCGVPDWRSFIPSDRERHPTAGGRTVQHRSGSHTDPHPGDAQVPPGLLQGQVQDAQPGRAPKSYVKRGGGQCGSRRLTGARVADCVCLSGMGITWNRRSQQ